MSDATRTIRERPLSPHMQVWRWHITMATSILHRGAIMALYVGALILAVWAVCLASGPEAYGAFTGLLGSLLGKLVLFGLTAAAFYYIAKGVQHLFWDFGKGFRIGVANAASVATIAFTAVATIVVWIIAAITGAL